MGENRCGRRCPNQLFHDYRQSFRHIQSSYCNFSLDCVGYQWYDAIKVVAGILEPSYSQR